MGGYNLETAGGFAKEAAHTAGNTLAAPFSKGMAVYSLGFAGTTWLGCKYLPLSTNLQGNVLKGAFALCAGHQVGKRLANYVTKADVTASDALKNLAGLCFYATLAFIAFPDLAPKPAIDFLKYVKNL